MLRVKRNGKKNLADMWDLKKIISMDFQSTMLDGGHQSIQIYDCMYIFILIQSKTFRSAQHDTMYIYCYDQMGYSRVL